MKVEHNKYKLHLQTSIEDDEDGRLTQIGTCTYSTHKDCGFPWQKECPKLTAIYSECQTKYCAWACSIPDFDRVSREIYNH